MTEDNHTTEEPRTIPIEASLQAEASSANARVNIPLNLSNWKERPREEQDELLWFHQHILDENLSWDDACKALGYDRTTIYRLLKGMYEAESWTKPIRAIRSYRKLHEQRAQIQTQDFAQNSVSRLIWAGLDYALANGSITTIIGESRQGKTVAVDAWAVENNHGRSVKVVAPPVGGIKMLMRQIAARVGANKNQSLIQLSDSLHRAFNKNRILIVDEAHRLMPQDSRTINPAALELLRDLHDQTGCALALVATARFADRLKTGAYQFEQLIGRIGMPIRLPAAIRESDVLPIVTQFLAGASKPLIAELVKIANRPGRLGIMVETLKVASRIAAKARRPLDEEHIEKAIEFRNRMTGEGH
jgi:DNA transposition AAA+ family ATPase